MQKVSRALVMTLVAMCLAGCEWEESDGLVSPQPTLNRSAHRALTYKVTPQMGFVDTVKATGDWVISKHACAPKRPISGTFVENVTHVDAKVLQQGGSYLVTVLTDQFQDDDCRWQFADVNFRLFNRGKDVGGIGVNDNVVNNASGKTVVVCQPSAGIAFCGFLKNSRDTLLKHQQPGIFSFVIEEI